MSEEITRTGGELVTQPAPADEMGAMMRLAVEQGESGVAALERIFEMRARDRADAAEVAFAEAMCAFQAECPAIERSKGIPDKAGVIKYRYAPLEAIVAIAGPIMQRHGISFSFSVAYPDGDTEVSCCLRVGRHSVTSPIRMPGVQVPMANAAQNSGAAITYGKRIAFLNATGIVTADEDLDAADYKPTPAKPITESQLADLSALLDELAFTNAEMAAFLEWLKIDRLSDLPADKFRRAILFLEKKREEAK